MVASIEVAVAAAELETSRSGSLGEAVMEEESSRVSES